MLRKFGDIISNLLYLGILVFWMYGTAVYAPDSPATPFIWIIGLAVFGYIGFSIWCNINDRRFTRKMKEYYQGRRFYE